jgi:phospholipase/carboxylesterase
MTHLPCVEIEPQGPATSAVVWLHGLGASGHDFEPIVPYLRLPSTRFVFPHAPERPVTINGGWVMPAWYDIKSLSLGKDREDADDIRRSAVDVVALIDRERARGVPTDRIVLAGFSQGGAMALHVGHRYPEKLAGLLILSAYLVLEDTFAAEGSSANAATPAMVMHGSYDDVVPMDGGRQIVERLTTPGRDVRWKSYPMGHEVCPPQIRDVAEWLHTIIP